MLSVTQTEESHVKSLWCRHWSKTRNRSRLLFVPQVQPDATFPLCCELVLFHICCDLRFASCTALSIISSVTWAPRPRDQLQQSEGRYHKKLNLGFSRSKNFGIRLIFVMPYWSATDSSFHPPPLRKSKEQMAGSAAGSTQTRWMTQCRSGTFQQGRCLLSARF